MPALSRLYARWLSMCARLCASLGGAIGNVAYLSAVRPFLAIGFCVLVTFLCLPGFLRLEVESGTWTLWADQGSEAKQRFDNANELFPRSPEPFRFLIQAKDAGDNALTVDAFKDAFLILDEVRGVEHAGLTYSDVCSKNAAGKCRANGALRFFDHNKTMFEATASTDAGLLAALSANMYGDGRPVNRAAVFGNIMTEASSSDIVSAPIWRLDLLVQPGHVAVESTRGWQKEAIDRFVLDGYAGVKQQWPHIHVELWTSGRSMEDEVKRNTSGDFMFMLSAYFFLVMSCAVLLGPPLKCVQGRRVFGACDFFIVFSAILAGYGVASAFGIPFTTLQQILPFILVGIGVDDAYVIIGGFDRTDRSMATEERVREALETVGMSITLTSTTSLLSFVSGALTSSFPGLSYFCAYAGISVVFIYMFHITAFCAILALDVRRQDAGRWDVLCCVKASAGSEMAEANSLGEQVMGKLGKVVTSNILVKITIVSAFLCSGSLFFWQAVENTNTEFSVLEMIPDDSYMRDFFDTEQKYWGGDSTSLDQLIRCHFTGIEQRNADIQALMAKVESQLLALKCVREESLASWHRQFDVWANLEKDNPPLSEPVSASTKILWTAHDFKQVGGRDFLSGHSFDSAVKYWLSKSDLGFGFKSDVVFKEGGISASRVTVVQVNAPRADDKADFLTEIDTFIDDVQQYLPNTFAVTKGHMLADGIRIIRKEAIVSVLCCIGCSLVVSTVVISHPVAIAVVFGAMSSVFIHLLGWLPLTGMSLNGVTLVNFVMAIGLVVDYMMHVVHSFMIQDSELSPNERAVCTMKEIGVSVLLGIFSTFIAIVPLAFASSAVFRVFFNMFVGILLIGGLHGLVLVPVVLSIFGPVDITASNRVQKYDDFSS